MERHQDTVACRSRLFVRDHALFTQQAIHERRLSNIRSSDHRDADCSRVLILLGFRLETRQNVLHQIVAALTVSCGDRQRFADAEGMKVNGGGIGIQALRLVQGERNRLSRASQLSENEVVLRCQPRSRIDQKHQTVGLLYGSLCLSTHLRFDADGVLDESAGIHDNVWNGTHSPVAVLPIACESRNVGDDSVTRAGQHVEQRGLADVGSAYESDNRQHKTAAARSPGLKARR